MVQYYLRMRVRVSRMNSRRKQRPQEAERGSIDRGNKTDVRVLGR